MHLPSAVSLHRLRTPRGHLGLIVAAVAVLAAAVLLVALPDRAGPPPSTAPAVGKLALEREPYLGVACPQSNAVACGRVGLTAWLREPAARVEATIAGESVRLAALPNGEGRVFEGFVQRPGFIEGTLGVRPDPGGRWEGEEPTFVPVRVSAFSPDGKRSEIELRLSLAPGYG